MLLSIMLLSIMLLSIMLLSIILLSIMFAAGSHFFQLECRHIFCFLCVKGVAIQSKRCPMCRREIPPDYLEHPDLVQGPVDPAADKGPPTAEDASQVEPSQPTTEDFRSVAFLSRTGRTVVLVNKMAQLPQNNAQKFAQLELCQI
jgi:hypothetical protein